MRRTLPNNPTPYSFNFTMSNDQSPNHSNGQFQPNVILISAPNIVVNNGLFAVIQPANGINNNHNSNNIGSQQQLRHQRTPMMPNLNFNALANMMNFVSPPQIRQPVPNSLPNIRIPNYLNLPILPPLTINSIRNVGNAFTPTQPNDQEDNAETSLNAKANKVADVDDDDGSGYKCDKCNKKFKRKTNLNAHYKVHTDYAFVCPFCQKKFARNGNLKQHIRIHTGERPYKCSYCKKAFRQKHSLHDHERIHTGEKPFGCKYCSMRFAARCNLIVHERTHTGCTPYECKQCNKKYASKSGLNAHLRKFHSNT